MTDPINQLSIKMFRDELQKKVTRAIDMVRWRIAIKATQGDNEIFNKGSELSAEESIKVVLTELSKVNRDVVLQMLDEIQAENNTISVDKNRDM